MTGRLARGFKRLVIVIIVRIYYLRNGLYTLSLYSRMRERRSRNRRCARRRIRNARRGIWGRVQGPKKRKKERHHKKLVNNNRLGKELVARNKNKKNKKWGEKLLGRNLGGYDHRANGFRGCMKNRKESSRFDRVDSPLDIPFEQEIIKFKKNPFKQSSGHDLCLYKQPERDLHSSDDRANFFFSQMSLGKKKKWRPSRLLCPPFLFFTWIFFKRVALHYNKK